MPSGTFRLHQALSDEYPSVDYAPFQPLRRGSAAGVTRTHVFAHLLDHSQQLSVFGHSVVFVFGRDQVYAAAIDAVRRHRLDRTVAVEGRLVHGHRYRRHGDVAQLRFYRLNVHRVHLVEPHSKRFGRGIYETVQKQNDNYNLDRPRQHQNMIIREKKNTKFATVTRGLSDVYVLNFIYRDVYFLISDNLDK